MKIDTVKLIYFSPTRTTRKVLEGIAAGINAESVEHLDLTLPAAGKGAEAVHADLAILGVPVYAGRVPQTAVDRISRLKAENVPAVIVAVYGNRPYKERHLMPTGSPTTQEALCTLCGNCAEACPVDAISIGDTVVTDAASCIYCCACIKICPTDARVMTVPKINEIAGMLSKICADRKAPEYYI